MSTYYLYNKCISALSSSKKDDSPAKCCIEQNLDQNYLGGTNKSIRLHLTEI